MAIEDAFTLAGDLAEGAASAGGVPSRLAMTPLLDAFFRKRLLRVSAIHGMAGALTFDF